MSAATTTDVICFLGLSDVADTMSRLEQLAGTVTV